VQPSIGNRCALRSLKMKTLFAIITSLVLTNILSAKLTVSGIDFSKAENITSILEGVNKIRGIQHVTLILDKNRKLEIIESSNFRGSPVTVLIKKNDAIIYNRTVKMSWKDFIIKLNDLAKNIELNEFPLMVQFDSDVTGLEGYQKLKDLCDNKVLLIFSREENREERQLRLEKLLDKKPASPSANQYK